MSANRLLRSTGGALLAAGLLTAGLGAAPVLLPLLSTNGGAREAVDAVAGRWPSPVAARSTGAPPVTARPDDGAAFAVLRVPRFGAGYSRVIAEGLSARHVLDTGAIGHYPTSAMPGALGDFAIAGHREAAGGPLLRLPDLRPGDVVLVDTAAARYVYRVTSERVVDPGDVGEVAPVPGHPGAQPTRRLITLQTCTPPLVDTDRVIVHGVLVSWAPR